MREQFRAFFDDTFGSVVSGNTEFGTAWAQEIVDSLGGNLDSPESMRTLTTNVENMIDSALYTALGEENYSVAISMADSLGFTDWDLLGTELQTSLYNTLVEAVGGEKTIALFESLGYSLPDAIQTGIDNAGGVDAPTIDAPDASAISTAVEDAVAAAETTATDKFGNIEVTANSTAKVIQGLDSDTLPILKNLVNDSETAYAEVQNAWSGTEAWFKNNVADPMSNGFSNNNWKQAGAKAASGIKAGLKSVKMPAIKVDWSITSKSFEMFGQNTVIKVPIPNLKFYAGGGFPDSGELFMANENGASELVGRIGNRSAVANQDQIGDAIFQYMDAHAEENGMDEERLAAAMVSAMRSAGIGSVYIDGRRITQAINRESQRSGKPALNY